MYWCYLVLKKLDLKIKPDKAYYEMIVWMILTKPIKGYGTFEYDSKNVLHMNWVFCVAKKLDYDKIKIKGCNLHFETINNKWDMFNIMKYIHKDYILI